jgi:hypothetical protein
MIKINVNSFKTNFEQKCVFSSYAKWLKLISTIIEYINI